MNFVYSSQQIKLVNSLDRYISLKTINTMRQTIIESYLNQNYIKFFFSEEMIKN